MAYFLENNVAEIKEALNNLEDFYKDCLTELEKIVRSTTAENISDSILQMQKIKSRLNQNNIAGLTEATKSVLFPIIHHSESITKVLNLLETACKEQTEASVKALKGELDTYFGGSTPGQQQ